MIEIESFKSAADISFGISQEEVIEILGNPTANFINYQQDREMYYDGKFITLANNKVVEIGFMPTCRVFFRGVDVFSDENAFTKICQIDGNPQESVGIIVLLNVGLSMSGFHDGDEAQKGISAFSTGRWDIVKPELKPFDVNAFANLK